MEESRLNEPVSRVTIWSIVQKHHLLFAGASSILWLFGIVVLVKDSLSHTGFWPVSLALIQGMGPVTVFAVCLPFALLKGVETVVTLYEAARIRRAEEARRAREEEREAINKALRAFIESKGEHIKGEEVLAFLDQQQEEAGATSGKRSR